ncbi:MAG: glycosyltransferase family 2 protein, partial [Candidatus Marinimicrobia bacterium]|nr:glycosyltransferase family 2 protein [Candidatus Neomarinimicrobiota bacterium]
MIVKNEAACLADCLESVADIVDQIVVVDTGSEDDTVKIAKSFNAEVYNFEWQNNFAQARNESIKHAKSDWILWMDADERLLPDSKTHLQKLLRKEKYPIAYKFQIQNLQKDKKTNLMSDGHRLFTNYKDIYFSGRIH